MERVAWTDERLDDLARRVDVGFDRVDRDIREEAALPGGLPAFGRDVPQAGVEVLGDLVHHVDDQVDRTANAIASGDWLPIRRRDDDGFT